MPTHDPQMLKGVLALLLLSVLSEDDGYGYAIVTRLRDAGFADLAEGTVYPALTRLEKAGQLESYLRPSESGPARKYYRTTSAGRLELERRRAAWAELVEAVDRATAAAGTSPTHTSDATSDTGDTSTTTDPPDITDAQKTTGAPITGTPDITRMSDTVSKGA